MPDGHVYASLGELDEVLGGWRNHSDDIRTDGTLLADAYYSVRLPSADVITAEYVAALSATFGELYRHNDQMVQYAEGYAERLAASRQQMAAVENEIATTFSRERGI